MSLRPSTRVDVLPTQTTLTFFEKKLEGPCPNHAYAIRHALKDCSVMKRFMSNGPTRGEPWKKEPEAPAGEAEAKANNFPEPDGSV